MSSQAPSYHFDIDHYLNPFVPRNRLNRLPQPISHFLGIRSEPGKPIGSVLIWLWSCVGAFCGILVVEAVYSTPLLRSQGTPMVIASLGASAILKYNTIDSPLSQPRNAILGQLFSSLVGISIAKLFLLSPSFPHIRFVGGALAVGLSSMAMGFTKTVHPPAGATALLAVTSNEVMALGWFLVPLIVLGAVLMCGVACVINNIGRTWPVYWWTPVDLDRLREEKKGDGKKDVEKNGEEDGFERSGRELIVIDGNKIVIPGWITLGVEEKAVLEILKSRLEKGLQTMHSRGSEATFVSREDASTKVGGEQEKVASI